MATDHPSSVHNIETSVNQNLPTNYSEYRRRHCLREWKAAFELYTELDSLEVLSRTDKLSSCRSFAYFARNIESGKVRVVSSACKLRWCPVCAHARSAFLVTQVNDWLKLIKRPKFLTLTMKHSNAPLAHQITHLYQHFRRFRMRKRIKSEIRGGIWFFQLKKSKQSNQWHPHLHTIIDSNYIPQKLLSNEWRCQTGHSSIVDIRSIRSTKSIAEYVSRYCAKPCKLSDFELQERIEIHRVFHGRRLCGTWGTGNSADLSRKSCSDRDSWVSVGSWNAVVSQRETLPRARTVLRAWLTNTTIPKGIVVSNKRPSYSDSIDAESIPNLGIEDLSGQFSEFL